MIRSKKDNYFRLFRNLEDNSLQDDFICSVLDIFHYKTKSFRGISSQDNSSKTLSKRLERTDRILSRNNTRRIIQLQRYFLPGQLYLFSYFFHFLDLIWKIFISTILPLLMIHFGEYPEPGSSIVLGDQNDNSICPVLVILKKFMIYSKTLQKCHENLIQAQLVSTISNCKY